MKNSSPITILWVEDDPADVRLTQETFKEFKMVNNFTILNNGGDVLKFLRKEDLYKEASTPDLIILDLNLPRKNGIEILAEIRADETFTDIPVGVLTSSTSEIDIINIYNLKSNFYLTKPVEFFEFIKIITSLPSFGLAIVNN